MNITKFGAFVNILPGRDGLVHISKLGGGKRINRVEDVLELGQPLAVVVEDVDPNGKISLMPAGDEPAEKADEAEAADAPAETDEFVEVESSDSDPADDDVDAGSDDDDDDYNSIDEAPASTGPVEVGFEAAFSAELETVHGDLGVAAPTNRGGGRRRRGC